MDGEGWEGGGRSHQDLDAVAPGHDEVGGERGGRNLDVGSAEDVDGPDGFQLRGQTLADGQKFADGHLACNVQGKKVENTSSTPSARTHSAVLGAPPFASTAALSESGDLHSFLGLAVRNGSDERLI